MTEERIVCGDDVIHSDSPGYRELIEGLTEVERIADKVIRSVKPSLLNERYFTTDEVMLNFRISRRALQNYRDNGTIPYTSIGGVMLYPESKIREVLEKSYYRQKIYKSK